MTAAAIRRLTLSNFRSYHAASLEAGGNVVVLIGPNGAGKTNLIEAVSFLMPGRGLRRATLEEVAFSEGEGAWAVAAEVEGMLGLATLGTGIEPPGPEDTARFRQCRIDREPVSSAVDKLHDADAILVQDDGKPVGVLTRQDLLGFIAQAGAAPQSGRPGRPGGSIRPAESTIAIVPPPRPDIRLSTH